jgi:non-specific serine/threonine protein kinase/serine/threonine-protein kinase
MDTQDWQEVKRLFGEALEMPEHQRQPWLETVCPAAEIRNEVLSLLEEYSRSEDFLEEPETRTGVLLDELFTSVQPGQTIGPWKLVREIGRGGMGVVFEAVREGEDFQARFALKLVRAGLVTPQLVERFRFERRVLSRLAHPGIAALLDGGTTDSGLPYLVMEYVEGIPIDQWCREKRLGIRQRVELILEVCRAVQHAHERLVIHRDLKPGNIFVTAEGRPKLLDFGIAKVLAGDGGDAPEATRTGTYVLTPEYASPEQITGAPPTTATDVYSLGVLLYVLLSGKRPYDLAGLPPLEAMRRVVESDPRPPSAVAAPELRSMLRGDLDQIVLKCMQKEPARRYSSAAQLAADLEAWLEGKPVTAVPPSRRYRLARWARRNRAQAVALVALAVSILAGGIATAWQAREAHLARQRAEQRALEIQQFSRSLVFDLHSVLSRLPGSTEARALLLDRAMQFFDGAVKTAGEDPRLLLELAEGYRRLGNVLGSSFSDNLGRSQEALQAFDKGLAAVAAARRLDPYSYDSLRRHSSLLVEAALASNSLKHRQEASRYASQLEQVIHDIESRLAALPEGRSLAATNWSQLAMILNSLGQREQAMQLYGKALTAFASLPPAEAAKPSNLSQEAFAYKRLGALWIQKDPAKAEEHYLKALAIDRKLLEQDPKDLVQRYNITFALSDLGLIARNRGEMEKSFRYFSEAAAIRDEFYASDPKNVRVLAGTTNVHCHLVPVLGKLGRFEEARRESTRCQTLARELAKIRPDTSGCGPVPMALLTAAELAAAQAGHAPVAARRRFSAEAETIFAAAEREHSACAVPDPSFNERAQALRKRLAQLSQ